MFVSTFTLIFIIIIIFVIFIAFNMLTQQLQDPVTEHKKIKYKE